MSRVPNDVRVTALEIPFISLTWFFVKASLALAMAFALTSWVWVLLGSGVMGLTAALLIAMGVPEWFEGDPAPTAPATPRVVAAPSPPPPAAPPPLPEPAEEQQDEEEELVEAPPEPDAEADPHQAATEAAMRAELQRSRTQRSR